MTDKEITALMEEYRSASEKGIETRRKITELQDVMTSVRSVQQKVAREITKYVLEDQGYKIGETYERNGVKCTLITAGKSSSSIFKRQVLKLEFAPMTKTGKPGKRTDWRLDQEISLNAYPEIGKVLKEVQESEDDYQNWFYSRLEHYV